MILGIPLEQAIEGRRQVLESRGGVGLDPFVVRILSRRGVSRDQSLARQFTNAMARLKLLNLIWRSSDGPSSGSCQRLSSSANNALSSSSARAG